MNVSLRWIEAIAPDLKGADPEALAERLASLGFPVESIQHRARGLDDIVVGHVLAVSPHPNADRLRVCRVDGGQGEVQVVCGAPNVVAGGWYPLAPVGASLPGGMEIRKAKLRGEVSEGMLCSERELELGRDQGGLMTLAEGAADALYPGQPLRDALGLDDVLLEVDVTSNRPDLLSHRGVARELAASGERGLSAAVIPGERAEDQEAIHQLDVRSGAQEVEGAGATIRVEDAERCLRYLGLVLRGLTIRPSPTWLQNRLRSIGARPINNVVDATNLVLFELGQPLHAFDLNTLADRTVVVRRAGAGEVIRTLDGVERALTPDMLAICDGAEPVAVAGVMGGEASEVTGETTDVLLECALFTPGPIRATRKALGLSTDASYRFERGVDPEGMLDALRLAARLILQTAGGAAHGPILEVAPAPFVRQQVHLRPARVEKLLGVPFTPEAIESLLAPLGFTVKRDPADPAGPLVVAIPGFRSYDVRREVDLIEEIARRHGYDAFPETLGAFRPGTVPDDAFLRLEDRIRDLLVMEGFFEAQTPAFAGAAEGEVALQNPMSSEEGFLRRTLLPALLRRVSSNLSRGNRDVRLFEIGTGFRRGEPGAPPVETPHLALVLHGSRHPGHWTGAASRWDFWDVKGIMERLGTTIWGQGCALRPVGSPEATATPDTGPWGAGETIELLDPNGVPVGRGGAVRPDVLDLPVWADQVWGVELALPVPPAPLPALRYRPIPRHPGVDRDLALLLPAGWTADAVLEIVRANAGPLLTETHVFDQYTGKGLPEGVRSVGFRLRFRADDRTLTEAEVDGAVGSVLAALGHDGIERRGS
jgi:phenylalanyl-tRNA synthetase beta chain